VRSVVHYIPLLTTVLAVVFAVQLYRRWQAKRPAAYLFWWMLGVAFYGVGTLAEGLTTIFGWSPWLFTSWYIAGALLGGFPLAQGTVYLILRRRTANVLTAVFGSIIVVAAGLAIASPINADLAEPFRLSSVVLEWQWIRNISPLVNGYAAVFLIGGAVWSAWTYWRKTSVMGARVLGNVFIAIGALLPGIGGSYARMGVVEVLYVTELVGILFIWSGYRIMSGDDSLSIHAAQRAARRREKQLVS